MKVLQKLIVLGLLAGLLPLVGYGALTSRQKNTLLGKFFVSNVKGTVTCISDGRIRELKKGDVIVGRGAKLETSPDSNITIVFSNQTAVYVDERTKFEVEKFDQEFFAPNNNLRVEPSNSSTIVRLDQGRVVINTPRLLSGTTMVYETEHAAIYMKGEKILIEGDEKQTHVAMIDGNASVNVRDKDGVFVSIGKRLQTGQEAFVKRTVGGATEDSGPENAKPKVAPAAAVAAKPPASQPPVTKATEAVIVRFAGSAFAQFPGSDVEVALTEGMKIPASTILTTADGAEVLLQPFVGTIATIRGKSRVIVEKLSVTKVGETVQKQSAVLDLKSGTIISTIDPARRDINDYGIRTPKGIAKAQGTSFAVSVEEEGFSVAATADTVSFTTPAGVSYSITAGNVTVSPAGGEPQPPMSLANAVASNPAFIAALQNALSAVTSVVQNNVGGLSAESATNLVTKVAHTVAEALPQQAAAIAVQVMGAVNAPTSATASSAAITSSAVTSAIIAAAPSQAVAVAVSATAVAPAQAVSVAAAAAKTVPAEASQIAAAVTRNFIQLNASGSVTDATLQSATAIAAAVTTSAPAQAAPVAAAVMQALAQAAPQTTPQTFAQNAATIASAVTASAPTQAVPVAATMMTTLTQQPSFSDASPQIITQTAATLAASVTTVVPPQAQEIATAVMRSVVTALPNATTQTLTESAGVLAATVSQVSPGQAQAIAQGIAEASNLSAGSVTASAATSAAQASQISQQLPSIAQAAAAASQQSSAAGPSVNTGVEIAASINNPGANGSSGNTASNGANGGSSNGGSSSTAQNSNNGGSGGNSGTGGSNGNGTGGNSSGGNGSSSSTAQNSNSGDSGGSSGSGGASGSGSGNGGSSGSSTASTGGSGSGGSSGGGELGGSGTGGGTGGAGGTDGTPPATTIVINSFDPGTLGDLASNLDAAQSAQGGVQFDTGTGPDGSPTVVPVTPVPSAPPVEFNEQSPANQ